MDEIEVVIRIPEEWIEQFKAFKHPSTLETVILQGIVLPKGHGKLIDSNVLWDAFQDLGQDFYEAFDFAEANAVIEADKEAEND